MTARSALALALGLSCVAASSVGCSSGGGDLTELVVVVRADVAVPRLRVTVAGPDGVVAVDEQRLAPSLPLSLVLLRERAPFGPITVHAEGGDVVSDTVTEFSPGQRRRLDVWLSASCACTACGASQTCREGSCQDRHVAASDLPRWTPGTDAGVAAPRDAGGPIDVGPPPDGGPPCGCSAQPCCAGSCRGGLSCRMDVCRDCSSSSPTLTGTTGASTRLTAASATGDTMWISKSEGGSITQSPIALAGGLRATGTAPFVLLTGMSGTGSVITVRGPSASTATLMLEGAAVSGSFVAPTRPDGSEGWLASATASGHTLTLTAWDGSSGTLTFTPLETCR